MQACKKTLHKSTSFNCILKITVLIKNIQDSFKSVKDASHIQS